MVGVRNFSPRTGRLMREDDSIVNEADGINDDGSRNVKVIANSMELYGKSTDVKSTDNINVGTTFLEIDTKNVFIFDGTKWGLL